ncbi:MAG TPA: NusA-like transcription termination signal-binding factor [Methanocorpusculum sp.]|nr:NusA-like transcription termination signal-binding factor [Methanocorpusculum sp.]
MNRSIGFRERRYIEELRIVTKSTAVDCIVDDRYDRIIYVIQKGQMGLAIGKSGENIRKLSTVLGRRIEMVEWDEKPGDFIANCFKPAEIVKVEIGETVSVFMPDKSNIGLAIGKGGATIEKARTLIKRFFNKDLEDMKTLDEEK